MNGKNCLRPEIQKASKEAMAAVERLDNMFKGCKWVYPEVSSNGFIVLIIGPAGSRFGVAEARELYEELGNLFDSGVKCSEKERSGK